DRAATAGGGVQFIPVRRLHQRRGAVGGNRDQQITITPAIARDISQLSADSTVVGIKQGETYTLRDLLYGLLLKSGNDAAIVIADTLGGNLPHFVAEMNQRAKQLGLNDTHYMNPHGLLATGHYSSAHDLAILGQYSLSIPIIHQISGTQVHIIPKGGNHQAIPLINGNQFLFWYPGTDGGKPGFDNVAYYQVISVTRNHHHLIGVTMRTNNWWTDMRDLMNWGFDNFKWVSPRDLDTAQNPIPYDSLWNYFASDKKENTIPTANGGRYYIYTGYSISGPIMTYYDQGGGLQHFGYPISLPTVSSSTLISQHFEKATIQCDVMTKQCSTQ
ncbi:MAG TPA: serine hydrolase, partial [Ktedonobacteraceae bacterium]